MFKSFPTVVVVLKYSFKHSCVCCNIFLSLFMFNVFLIKDKHLSPQTLYFHVCILFSILRYVTLIFC